MAVAGLAFSLNSCSSSDSGSSSPGGTVTVKINGVSKTFTTTVVDVEVYEDGTPDEYTELTVTATIGTSTTEIITFVMEKGGLGSDAIYEFYYIKDGAFCPGNLATNVTTNNTGKKLIGSFSGAVSDGTTDYTFTEGTFNVQY